VKAKAGYRVFLSYARKDSRSAQKLATQIEATGAAVFLDEFSLEAGEAFQAQIDRELRGSDEVVALVTENSIQSRWWGFEVGAALGLQKRVVSIIDGVKVEELPPPLRSLQSVDVRKISGYLSELSERVNPSPERVK
jgi:hypothetical protein